ncbi:tripartite tricarboxylate transporter substrate binding protein [uncultured Xylophilus sp.]|uniref:tripartite tricarboxylate transporter substrate binding protein n=1 Tax=uncultured Xylophilus sp. TaxID=296832 RepID=UPI0025CBCC33|nr:tripartite tricarboxylate transporter substrate binding protein [uncultured Xylophilus sp.]
MTPTSARPGRTRRRLLAALPALCAAPWVAAQPAAAAFPARPLRIVVPYPAGGATDILARVLAEKLAVRFGQPVLVENRPGASAILGTDTVAKAAPDGHTVVLTLSQSLLTNIYLYDKLPYDPRRDLTMVTQVAMGPVVLVVHPSVPAATGPELLAYVKANKGKLSYGSWGVGAYPHLAGAHMSATQQADMTHIAYKGEAPMMQDLVAGQIPMAYASVLQAKPYLDSGRIKAIGATGERRLSVLPQLPTLAEQGLTDPAYRLTGWLAVAAPAGTPAPVVQRWADEIRTASELPDVSARIAAMGFERRANTPQQFAAAYQAELPVWEQLVRQSGAKLE